MKWWEKVIGLKKNCLQKTVECPIQLDIKKIVSLSCGILFCGNQRSYV